MKEKIYVHVADDHKILIEGIIAVINTDKEIEIKGYSLTGQEVIDWFGGQTEFSKFHRRETDEKAIRKWVIEVD